MKITKYAIVDTNGNITLEYYQSETKAEKTAAMFKKSGWKVEVIPVEIDLFCDACDRDLTQGDEYLKVDEHTRYCSDCYEEEQFTYYTVGGETVSDENDGRVHEKGKLLD
ncbi:hypothetical protein NE261_00600 [Enterococcus italicus]|uniref:hypothetical protein n=1 Tax=Enterococcus italicus TaxID=246144 RepID=UPI002072B1B1|nr:hypothetical protein [Enterococcus italicus]MCM6930318.1 hypothetical protein [Enterococcus italicus]